LSETSILSSGTVLGRIFRSPLKMLPPTLTLPIMQGPMRGMKWIVGSQRHACWMGAYESYVQRIIAEELKPGAIFYDVGANAGFYSLLASRLVGNGKVFAFEPLPQNIQYLQKHLVLNGIKNVEVFAMAISDRAGTALFQQESTRAMGRIQENGDLQVATSSLDILLREQTITPPTFIKMDIEGEEFKALLGARECLERSKPVLLLATHGEDVHRECCQLLGSWSFRIKLLGQPSEGRAEILATFQSK
jgi:FkbM family methyltransferase